MEGSPYLASGEHGIVWRRHVGKEARSCSSRSGGREGGGVESGLGEKSGENRVAACVFSVTNANAGGGACSLCVRRVEEDEGTPEAVWPTQQVERYAFLGFGPN